MGAKVMHEFVAGLAANFQDNRETSSLGVGTIADGQAARSRQVVT